jgi:hypothetical protein
MDLREYTGRKDTKFLGYPRTRRYLGDNRTRVWGKSIEKDNVSSISNQLGYFRLAIYPYPTYGYASGKYTL